MRCPSCTMEISEETGHCPLCTTPLPSRPEGSGRPPSPAPPLAGDGPFPPGRVFGGRYRIVRLVGRGGMGDVYQAEDLKLGQTVALKFLPRNRRHDRQRLGLLLNEVRLARQVVHPNVCRVYDVTEAEGVHFLSMEYVDGENLATLLQRIGRLPRERALALALEMCGGLDAAHQQGILHRDLKPANLMVDATGHVRITDFGLARLYAPAESGSPSSAARGGTPAYMAPELRLGKPATVASDLFALGLVLYELFTGRRAVSELPEPPSKWVRELSGEIEWAILGCLDPDPRRRARSAGEVAAALGQAIVPSWRPEAGSDVPRRPSWKLERKLSAGGAGDAWLAVHRKTGDRRVFKFCREPRFLPALKREITLFRLLKEELGDRDDIARILDWSLDEPPWFIESELSECGDLAAWAATRGGLAKVALAERLEIVAQAATALAAAHSIGVLHKDVKPANIFIYEDGGRPRARLADFGIGAVLEQERLERAGITVLGFTEHGTGDASPYAGTRLYAAPELLEGKPATLQADVYALGVVLYQVVVGDLTRALASGWQRDVGDPLLVEEVAAAVDGVPERRLGNALRLAENLRTLDERRAARQADQRRRRAERVALERSHRRRRLLLAALVATLLVTLGTLFWAHRVQIERDRAEREAARARNTTRVAVAGEWLSKDPTRAALLLLEVEAVHEMAFFGSRVRETLRQELAFLELKGHADFVRAAAWSADGRLLTASYDGTARIWNTSNGHAATVLRGHAGALVHAAWNRDGTRVATASVDGTARLWDLAVPGSFLELRGHEADVMWIAWSHDGSRVATTSVDGTARVWDAGDGRELGVLRGHTDIVWMAAWSGDDRRLLTTSYDTTACLWPVDDLSRPVRPRVLEGHTARIWMGAWSPDGRHVVTASEDGTARVWPAGKRESGDAVVLGGHGGNVRTAAWSPDGRRLATAADDGRVRLWSAPSFGNPVVLEGHEDAVWSVAWSPDGRRLLSTSKDATARVWSLDTPSAGTAGGAVLRGHGGHVEFGAWSPDGRSVVTTSSDRTARVWRPGSAGSEIVLAVGESAVQAISWHEDGRVLAVSKDGTARWWPADGQGGPRVAATDQVPFALRTPSALGEETWSPDGRRFVTAPGDGRVRLGIVEDAIGSAGTGAAREFLSVEGHRGEVHAAAWSSDGSRVATVSKDGSARIWDADTGAGLRVFQGSLPMLAVAWSPQDDFLLTGLTDGRVLAWKLGQGKGDAEETPSVVIQGHGLWISRIVFCPNGERFATTAAENRVLIWSFASVRELAGTTGTGSRVVGPQAVLEGHDSPPRSVAWSPDSRRLATASPDGTIRVWRLDTGELRQLLGAATRGCLDPEFRQVELGTPSEEARRRYEDCERSRGREPLP